MPQIRSIGDLMNKSIGKIKAILGNIHHRRIGRAIANVVETQASIPKKQMAVFYGRYRLPSFDEYAHGGMVKIQRLSQHFPNTPSKFTILYLVSSNLPPELPYFWEAVHNRDDIRVVLNQNGVAYPAWMPSGWEKTNEVLARYLHKADYVLFQSEFARKSSNKFLGERETNAEVLYNAVDTSFFTPHGQVDSSDELVLLVVGSQYQLAPVVSVLKTFSQVIKEIPGARLIFAGNFWPHLRKPARKLTNNLGLGNKVDFLPSFTQHEAPAIFRGAHILLHTKIQDVCPGVVIEAMACGLPVVHSESGGVPELVGREAGIGVNTDAS